MTPPDATARRLAVEILRAVLERGARASPLFVTRGRDLAPADQDLLRALVLGVLRNRARLDAELAGASRVALSRLRPDLREILEVAIYQVRHLDRVPGYAAVDEAVDHARSSAGEGAARLTNAILRELIRRGPPAEPDDRASPAALAEAYSHPAFLVERWVERLGRDETLRILAADNAPTGLDLMANSRMGSRAELARELEREGIATHPSELSPLGLNVVSGNPLRSALFREGRFLVQDVGSQVLPLLLPAGDRLVDLAAAPGGKSFASVLFGRAGVTVALDRSAERLRLVLQNRARLRVPEVLPVAGDFRGLPLAPGRFDRVLFDAPCSGTGTLRKNPEIRYRVTPAAIERLAAAQEVGLAAAAGLLAPAGCLLYSTCSLEEEENERVVTRVLAAEGRLEPMPIDVPEALRRFVRGNRFRILPGPESDGFTAHLLRRSA